MVRSIIWFFLLWFLNTNLFAQSPNFKHYGVESGLPSSQTYDIMQDSKGYIWVSTDRGVCRFDGYSFETYTTSNGLPDNTVLSSEEDRIGRIWFRTLSGKLAYFYQDSVHPLICNDAITELTKGRIISSIQVGSGDTLWASCISRNIAKPSIFYLPPPYSSVTAWNSPLFHSNNIFIKVVGNDKLIYGSNVENNEDERNTMFFSKSENTTITEIGTNHSNKSLRAAIQTTSGNYLLLMGNELVGYSQEGTYLKTRDLKHFGIALYEDLKGNIWVGLAENGVIQLRGDDPFVAPELHFLKEYSISCVYQDFEENFWFSTLNNGIYFLPSLHHSYQNPKQIPKDFNLTAINGNGSGTIWAGNSDGELFRLQKNTLKEISYGNTPQQKHHVNCISAIGEGKLYVSIQEKNDLLLADGNIELIEFDRNLNLKVICPSKIPNQIWGGNNKGLMAINLKANKVNYINPLGTKKMWVDAVYEDVTGTVWFGGIKGLWSFNGEKIIDKSKQHPLFSERITSIDARESGDIWCSTRGSGVIIIDNKKVYNINKSHGICNDLINNLYIDHQQDVWLTSNSGISLIKVKSLSPFKYSIYNYNSTDGLISNEVRCVYVEGDSVYLATRKGLSIFSKNVSNFNQFPPKIHITGFQVNNSHFDFSTKHQFDYNQNNVRLDFTGLNFRDPGKVLYRYKMEGLNNQWEETTNRQVSYLSLPAGDYRFYVAAQNEDGIWSEPVMTEAFSIAIPFWRAWWFWLIFSSISCFIIWLFIAIRYRELKRQAISEKMISTLEKKALQAQMNPHFIFNALNSIQHFISENDQLSAERYLAKFAKLIRLILNGSRDISISIEQEIDTLKLYVELERLRFKESFDFEVSVDDEIETTTAFIPSMLIQPYVENAILHGVSGLDDKGHIQVDFRNTNGQIICEITDNGIGREQSKTKKHNDKKTHKGAGMTISSERLNLLNKDSGAKVEILDVKDENNSSKGTKVILLLPLLESPEAL